MTIYTNWFQIYAFKNWHGQELKVPQVIADLIEEHMHPVTRLKNPKFEDISYYDDPETGHSFSVRIVPESNYLEAWF